MIIFLYKKGGVKRVSKEDDRTRFTFRMPGELLQKLKEQANRLGVSVNALILQVLWEWIQRDKH